MALDVYIRPGRLRSRRQRARAVARQLSQGYLGKRARKTARLALRVILLHHSGNQSELSNSLQRVWNMTWYCRTCQKNNPPTVEECQKCNAHWSSVWQPSKRRHRRSQSRPKAAKETKKDIKNNDGTSSSQVKAPEMTEWQVFPATAPWVTSTPTSRHTSYRPDLGPDLPTDALPPQPLLPAPPGPPNDLAVHFQKLTEKEKEAAGQPVLSHGHINRLHKLTNQVQQSVKKIQKVDQEWMEFASAVMTHFKSHVQKYQAHRQELLEQHHSKVKALEEAKMALKVASSSLLEQDVLPLAPVETVQTDPYMHQLQESIKAAGPDEELLEVSDVENEEDMHTAEELEDKGKKTNMVKTGHALAPFRAHNSHRLSPRTGIYADVQVKQVRFSEVVDFVCWEELDSHAPTLSLRLPSDRTQLCFRSLWHLDGLCSAFKNWKPLLCVWADLYQPLQTWGVMQSLLNCETCFSRYGAVGPYDMVLADMRQWLMDLPFWAHFSSVCSHHPRRVGFVETWFVDSTRFPMCLRSRRVRITPEMSDQDFQLACLRLWADHLRTDLAVDFVQVLPAPPGLRNTIGHVILLQSEVGPLGCALLYSQAPLAPLERYRAIVCRPGATALDHFVTAQLHYGCRQERVVCSIEVSATPQVRYSNQEVTPAFYGHLLQGSIRALPPEEVESDESDVDSEASTGVPSDHDELSLVELEDAASPPTQDSSFLPSLDFGQPSWIREIASPEDEEFVLMQADSPQSSPPMSSGSVGAFDASPLRSTYLFMVGREWSHAQLPAVDCPSFHSSLVHTLALPAQHVVGAYPLAVPPLGLPAASAAFVVHRTFDVAVAHMRSLVLCDVVVHVPAGRNVQPQPHIDRTARWIPMQLTRSQLLRELGVPPGQCLPTSRCLVLVNGVIFPSQSSYSVEFFEGDYVVVHVEVPDGSHQLRSCLPSSTDSQPQPEPTSGFQPMLNAEVDDGELQALLLGQDPVIQQAFHARVGPAFARIDAVTWFLHHDTFRVCHKPRTVALPSCPSAWYEAFRRAWDDLWDDRATVRFALAHPSPGAALESIPSPALHIVIEQAWKPRDSGILLSIEVQPLDPQIHPLQAAVVPTWSNALDIRRHANVEAWCPQRYTCRVVANGEPMDPVVRTDLHSGLCVSVILVRTRPSAESDFSHLLQHPLRVLPVFDRVSSAAVSDPTSDTVPRSPCVQGLTPAASKSRFSPVRLSLDACLPFPCSSPVVDDRKFGVLRFTEDAWFSACCGEFSSRFVDLPDGFRLPTSTYWAMARFLIGVLSGLVELCPSAPLWIGATEVDNIAAEFSAFAVAQAWALQLPDGCSACLRPDLSLSRQISCAGVTTTASPVLAQLVRLQGSWLPSSVSVVEVRGHTRHPWNDLADAVACWTCHHQTGLGDVRMDAQHRLALSPHDLQWAWTQGPSDSLTMALPPLLGNQLWQFEPSARRLAGNSRFSGHGTPTDSTDFWQLRMKCASINVLALGSVEEDLPSSAPSSRMARVDAQLHAASLGIVGVQEARTPQGQRQTEHYRIFASGADMSHTCSHGCELWLHKHMPLLTKGQGFKLTVSDLGFATLVADPRRLFLRATSGAFSLLLIVLHVPCVSSATSLEQLEEWWRATMVLCRQHVNAGPCLCFVDANAPLAAAHLPWIGSLDLESAKPQGHLFEAFVLELGFMVPSTHASIHQGPTATWTHPRGQRFRRDYVLVSSAWHELVHSSWVLSDWDGGFTHEDHPQPQEWERWGNQLKLPLQSLARRCTLGLPVYSFSVVTLAGLAHVLPPLDAVHLARLRYLARLVRVCPSLLWSFLCEADDSLGSWLALCRASLAWLVRFYPHPLPLTDKAPLCQWISFISLDSSWQGRLKTAAAAARNYAQAQAEALVWNRRFNHTFQSVGGVLPADPGSSGLHPWTCDTCSATFASKRALAMHSNKAHGYRACSRYFALDGHCAACARNFHSRKRLRNHLQVADACLLTLQACFPPLDEATAAALDEEELAESRDLKQRGWHAAKAFVPRLRLHGPTLPPADSVEAAEMLRQATARAAAPGMAFQQLRGRRQRVDRPSPSVWWQESDLPSFVMQSNGGWNRGDGRLDRSGLAREFARLHIRTLVVVHWFSGFRRSGDIHEIVAQETAGDNDQIFVLSIDMCMQKQAADLSSSPVSRWWCARIHSGQVIAGGGGPPCETFTAARFLEGGPEPVRSGTEFWGLANLGSKDHRQVTIGTRLVHFLLDVMLALAVAGGAGFFEHPQWPVWAASHDPPSVWAYHPMKMLKQLACCSIVSFDQCVVNADILKPTTILLIRMPWVRAELLKRGDCGRCCHGPRAHKALAGKDSEGAFCTGRGKIYPRGLNEILGRGLARFVRSLGPYEHVLSSQLPQEFEIFQQDIHEHANVVQPDYHG
eukprot:Skav205987  [mRNA]  locus=scaffold442:1074405:1084446:- [translate_table: standard]